MQIKAIKWYSGCSKLAVGGREGKGEEQKNRNPLDSPESASNTKKSSKSDFDLANFVLINNFYGKGKRARVHIKSRLEATDAKNRDLV